MEHNMDDFVEDELVALNGYCIEVVAKASKLTLRNAHEPNRMYLLNVQKFYSTGVTRLQAATKMRGGFRTAECLDSANAELWCPALVGKLRFWSHGLPD